MRRHAGLFRWKVCAIFAVALVLRFAHIWQIRSSPFFDTLLGDARGYDAWARQIAEGDWLGQGVFYQAPLYPYFLGVLYSVVGRDLLLVRICQAIIGAAGCALLACAGRRLLSERVGVIAGLGLAIYAPAMFFDGLLQKSVLDLFLLAVVLWLFSGIVDDPVRRSRWFFLGLALGTLALTRENALLLTFPIVLWRLLPFDVSWRSHAVRSTIVAFILGLSVVLLPVAVRNRAVGGEWHLTTSQFGSNFYLGNNPEADGTAIALREGRGSVEYERQDATELAQEAEGRTLTPREVSNYWTSQALAFIRGNPWEWTKLETRKLVLLTNRTELIDTESQESYEEWSPVLYLAARVAHFGILLPMAVLGLIVGWPDRRRLWPFYTMAITYAASVVAFYVSARYRLPLVPFLMLFAAVELSRLPNFIRSAGPIAVTATAVAVLALAVFANRPLWPSGLMRAVTENNLGNALHTDKRFREAEAHYKRAIEIHPEYTPASVNLAQLYANETASLVAAGRHDEAVTLFADALHRYPDSTGLRFRFGTLLLQLNRFPEAVDQFRAVIARSPHTPEAHGNLGAALAASGRPEEAIPEFEEALRLNPDLVSARRNLEIAREALKTKQALGRRP